MFCHSVRDRHVLSFCEGSSCSVMSCLILTPVSCGLRSLSRNQFRLLCDTQHFKLFLLRISVIRCFDESYWSLWSLSLRPSLSLTSVLLSVTLSYTFSMSPSVLSLGRSTNPFSPLCCWYSRLFRGLFSPLSGGRGGREESLPSTPASIPISV
jgi:hypothetical protein